MSCKYGKKDVSLETGCICTLTKTYCENWLRSDIADCPSLKEFEATGIKNDSTPNLGYAGIPKCFRTGAFGTFNGGMPPQYLRANARETGKK